MMKGFYKIWIVVIAVVFIAGGFFVWQYFGSPKPVACTEEAKIWYNEAYG